MKIDLEADQWYTPSPRPFTTAEHNIFGRLSERLVIWQNLQTTPEDCYGLELRQAHRILARYEAGNVDLPDFVETKLRRLFLRPAVEPIVASYREALAADILAPNTALDLARALAGRPVGFRSRPMYGEANGRIALFEPCANACSTLAALWPLSSLECDAANPFYVFARLISLHPFEDGNGRFARTVLSTAMAGSAAASLPLSPAFYFHASNIAYGTNAACLGRGLTPLYAALLRAFETALDLAMRP